MLPDAAQKEQDLSEQRYRAFLTQSSEGIWRIDLRVPVPIDLPEAEQIERFYRDAYLAECNDAMARMYGLERASDLVGVALGDMLVRSDPHNVAYLTRFIASGYRLMDAESHEVDVEGNVKFFRNNLVGIVEGGALVRAWGTQRDVTEQKRSEDALRESEAHLRAMFEQAGAGIAFVDLSGRILQSNQRFSDILGYESPELTGRTILDVTHPDDQEQSREIVRQLVQGEITDFSFEKRYLRKDGSTVWASVSAAAVRDDRGTPHRMVVVVQDVSDRKQAEHRLREWNEVLEQRVAERTAELERAVADLRAENEERLRAETRLEEANVALAQSNRELQDFAHIASHDLQEPLRKIRTFVNLIRTEAGASLGEDIRDYFDRMDDAAARMHQLTTDLLAFSRVSTQRQAFRRVDLRQVIDEVLSDLEVSMAETQGRVEVGDLCTVAADALQMRQLFQNLIGNALKFHPPGVAPLVRVTSSVESREDRAGGSAGPVCRIEVADNGIGFDEKYADRIFAPFQRLHGRGAYPGTGMGLAICRRIVERHGGTIEARSTPGQGATFTVILPLRPPAEAA